MFRSIINTFVNCFKIEELRSRIWFTVVVLAICRLEAYITIPGLDAKALQDYSAQISSSSNSPLALYGMFTGGAYEYGAIGALGIMPYITATIVMQLLTAVIAPLSKLAREEGGRVQIMKYSRYMTVVICLGQAFFMALMWEKPSSMPGFDQFHGKLVIYDNLWWFRFQTMIILSVGTLLLMWLGEQITERGIGNGVSLVITIGILARLPQAGQGIIDMFKSGSNFNFGNAIVLVVLLVGVVAGVIAMTQAQRKIPVQYAQRAVGRKIYSGGTSYLPLRLNFSGVMPIIFAGAVLMVPGLILPQLNSKFGWHWAASLASELNRTGFLYLFLYGLMILFFSYFWTATQFNELQIADDLKKNGGYVPGVRPGPATSGYLHNAMSRITLAGAICLTLIAVIPYLLQGQMNVPSYVAQFFGGTSLLITVGVMLDTMRQMETHLLMRHYDGFLKGGRGGGPRLRGRL